MVKVKATNMSMKMGQRIKELGHVAREGEKFEVSESRFEFLSGKNPLHKVYVIRDNSIEAKPVEKVEEVVEEPCCMIVDDAIEYTAEPVEEPAVEVAPIEHKRNRKKKSEAIEEEIFNG